MDLRAYFDFIRRRWFLLVLGPLLAGVGALFVFSFMTPVYRASTAVLVKPEVPETGAPPGDLLNFERFANTYAALMTSPSVLGAVIEREGLSLSTEQLQKEVEATPVKDTELIEVNVTDADPAQAVKLANMLPAAFIDLNPGRQATPGEVTIVRAAETAVAASALGVKQTLLLAAALGLMTSGLVCYALESLDDSVKSPTATETATGIPVVAEIGPIRFTTLPSLPHLPGAWLASRLDRLAAGVMAKLGRPAQSIPAAEAFLQSPSFEAFRHLRTAIDSSTWGSQIKIIAVTSPGSREGKSIAAMNLSMALAQAGNQVILVDADLWRSSPDNHPFIHSNHFGITGLLLNETFDPAVHDPTPALVATEVPNLEVLPCGRKPANPAELLSSTKMLRLLQALRRQADFVVIDTSPALAASEAVWLAGKSDVALLVVAEGRTRIGEVRRTMQLMENVSARVLGIIFNRPGLVPSLHPKDGMSPRSFEMAPEEPQAGTAGASGPLPSGAHIVEAGSPSGPRLTYVKGKVKQDGTTSIAN